MRVLLTAWGSRGDPDSEVGDACDRVVRMRDGVVRDAAR